MSARRHTQLLRAGRRKADELEPALVDSLAALFDRTADEAARAFSRTVTRHIVASAFAAGDDVVSRIRAVAEEHAPEGGYGETAWNAEERKVFWVAADWTSTDEAEAAEADFLAVDGVDSVERDYEAGLPEGDGWEQVWPVRRSLSAAAPLSTSTMVALYPNPDEAAALAVAGGEESDILHVTLAYLGETTEEQAAAVALIVEQVALEHVPRVGQVGGLGAFGTERDFDGQVFYPSIALPNVPGVAELRHAVVHALDEAGVGFSREYDFNPHLTLAYTEQPQMPPEDRLGMPLTFSRLSLARGDVAQHFRLGGEPQVDAELAAALEARAARRLPEAGILLAAGDSPPPADWTAPAPDEVLYVHGLAERLRAASEPARAIVAESIMAEPLAGVSIDFDVTNPLVGRALAGSGRNVTYIADTTRADVMQAIADANAQGLSVPHAAELIRDVIRGSSRSRAQTIARTELNRVANASSVAAVQTVSTATGETFLKRWLTADGAVNPRHEEYDGLDGQTVGLDEPFDVGGYPLQYPGDDAGPPEDTVNCRCTMEWVEAGDGSEVAAGGPVVVRRPREVLETIRYVEGGGRQEPALPSAHPHRRRRGRVMARGGASRQRRTSRRAAERAGATGLNEARGSSRVSRRAHVEVRRDPAAALVATAGAEAVIEFAALRARARGEGAIGRREAVLAALTAAGVEAAAQPAPVYDLAMGSPLELAFYTAAAEAGHRELGAVEWPCEAQLGEHGAVVARDGCCAVFRLPDGAIARVSIRNGWFYAQIAASSRARISELASEFASAYPALFREQQDDGTAPVTFWTLGRLGPTRRLRRIDATDWPDIEGNYSADVRAELDRLMSPDFEPGVGGQLHIWQGPPGTGKTWAIRALARAWSDWAEFHVVTDSDNFFVNDPSYMIDVLLSDTYEEWVDSDDPGGEPDVVTSVKEGKWRVLVLEDTGELLATDAKASQGQGVSRLLNVVDGMVGQGLRVLCLLTTNEELESLHPAAVRPGRCASQIVFGALSAEEASAWLGNGLEVAEPMTLAELYARAGEPADAFAAIAECKCGHMADQHEDDGGACMAEDCACEEFSPAETDDAPDEADPDAFDLSAVTFTQEALSAAAGALIAGAVGYGWDGEPPPGLAAEVRRMVLHFQTLELPPELAPGETLPPRRPTPDAPVDPQPAASALSWTAIFAPEGKATDDGRMFAPGAITWRDLPLTLMGMVETQDGHDGARVCGRIDAIWRDGSLIRASGVFDEGEFGVEIARMVADRTLSGLSVDIAIHSYEVVYESDVLDEDGNYIPPSESDGGADLVDILFGPDDRVVFLVTDGVIGAATVCPFPAFAEATISLAASGAIWTMDLPALFELSAADGSLAASAAAEAVEPPAELEFAAEPPEDWFADPRLEELTAMTVDDEGRVYGHAAAWDTCHIGIPEVCTTAPRSLTDYALFHRAEVRCDDGARVTTGPVTLGTSHADRRLGPAAAIEHYDNTGTAVADVQVGEDEHGIWVAGALRPGLSAERLRELRGSVLSGDWRRVNGNLELVALLCVNVPGFPVPRPRALVASAGDGLEVVTLLSAGVHDGRTADEVEAEVLRRFSVLETAAAGGFAALAVRARGKAA